MLLPTSTAMIASAGTASESAANRLAELTPSPAIVAQAAVLFLSARSTIAPATSGPWSTVCSASPSPSAISEAAHTNLSPHGHLHRMKAPQRHALEVHLNDWPLRRDAGVIGERRAECEHPHRTRS